MIFFLSGMFFTKHSQFAIKFCIKLFSKKFLLFVKFFFKSFVFIFHRFGHFTHDLITIFRISIFDSVLHVFTHFVHSFFLMFSKHFL
mmetsp:Transcript_132440/g.313982  ORF Transcript_132440/g.313982 Transcript_132440/m.313982 type:complete len:87 (-) Transcript_132440:322-582(-)